MEVNPGDRIEIKSQKVGAPVRRGTVRDVLSRDPFELRVQWDDGHESSIYPAGGVLEVIGPANAAQ